MKLSNLRKQSGIKDLRLFQTKNNWQSKIIVLFTYWRTFTESPHELLKDFRFSLPTLLHQC